MGEQEKPMSDEHFEVKTFVDGRHAVVMLSGDVDAAIYATFRAAAHAAMAATDYVTFDCGGVTFMDMWGLSVIEETVDSVTRRGGTVFLSRATRPVLRLLEITGFDNLVRVAETQQHRPGVHGICSQRPQRLAPGLRPCSARSG